MRAERWPVAAASRMIDTSLGRTFVRISGPASAPPLVLLHGIGGSSLMWTANVAALAEHFRVFAVDCIYDCGRSVCTRFPREEGEVLRWLDELFDGLGLTEGFHLAGLSYGGWLTSRYALHRPERLRKIVLLAPAATVLPLAPGWILRAVLSMLPLRWFTRSFIRWMLPDLAVRRADEAEAWVEDSFLAARSFKLRPVVSPTVLRDDEWRRMQVPALFLVGENERIYDAQQAVQRLRDVAPHVEVEIISDAGHDLTIVQADEVNAKIVAFLRGAAAG
jgi:pimeloyl-ACP methyl ester carboxylesterase